MDINNDTWMALKQRKTCNGCRFENIHSGGGGLGASFDYCELGYNTKPRPLHGSNKNSYGCIPLEPCPKPTTIKDQNKAGTHYKKRQVAERAKSAQ